MPVVAAAARASSGPAAPSYLAGLLAPSESAIELQHVADRDLMPSPCSNVAAKYVRCQ